MYDMLVREFNRRYLEDARPWSNGTFWRGVPTQKNPCDLWVYQQLIWELRPTLVIETGTFAGGSTLFIADVLHSIGGEVGKIISIDIEQRQRPQHCKIVYLHGNSTSPDMFERVKSFIRPGHVLVILDSEHSSQHVLREMNLYAPLVTPGSYLIVEDTNQGHFCNRTDTPKDAVEMFLANHPEFEPDETCERFILTFNPGGYLRRIG
jgi:cephalosporin hydroxylase